jgi:sensor histidine kinase YesM
MSPETVTVLKRWGIIFGAWNFIALFFVAQVIIISRMRGQTPPVDGIVQQFMVCYAYMLANGAVLAMSRRFRLERPIAWGRVFLHLAVTSLLVLFVATMDFIPIMATLATRGQLKWATFITVFTFNFDKLVVPLWLILILEHMFNYYRVSRENRLRAAELESQLAMAQLQALKMQLHPHFLFNSLNSISTLVLTKPEAAHAMIARLGDFLRMTINNVGTQEVSFQRELEFLETYLAIEKIRFGNNLRVDFTIDPDARHALVPNLLLQPLVENAIRHGISKIVSGRIDIRAKCRAGRLHIEIYNDGPTHAVRRADREGGLGLSNTANRLERSFPGDHVFEYKNDPEGGFEVIIDVPHIPAGRDADSGDWTGAVQSVTARAVAEQAAVKP